MKHSDSYGDQLGGPSGENLYWASWPAVPEKSVTAWYDEVKDCGPMPGCKTGKTGVVGHFTAMIWHGVKMMACTRSKADTGLIACRYGDGPNTALSCDTPNMGGCYETNVFAKSKTAEECVV